MTLAVGAISGVKLRVVSVNAVKDPRWLEFVASHPDALFYHHPHWLEALEKEYGQPCRGLACEDSEGQFRAVLPLFYTKGLPFRIGRHAIGRRLASLPRTPAAGPLAVDEESAAAVLRAAIERAKLEPGLQLEIKSHLPDLDRLVPELQCVSWRETYAQELPPVPEDPAWKPFAEDLRCVRECGDCKECKRLRFGNAKRQHRVNWAVNKAVKLGLTVRRAESEDDLRKWYKLYLLTMRHNAVPPRPYRLFESLWRNGRQDDTLRMFVAEHNSDSGVRLVAGSLLLRFGQTVFYAFTGCAPGDFCLHPHDLLQIEAIRDSCKSGFRWYDFGEVAEEHQSLEQFKTKWGTERQPLYRYYFPAVELGHEECDAMSPMRRAWRKLPARVTAMLGDLIYRYL